MAVLLVGQFGVYALAWVVVAWLVRAERGPALMWSAYCALQACALQWMTLAGSVEPATQPVAQATGLVPLGTLLLSLSSYLLAATGLDWFANGRPRRLALWAALWLVLMAVLLLGSWARWPAHGQALAYNLSVGLALFLPLLLLRPRLQREFGHWSLVALLPGMLMLAGVLWRSAQLVGDPSQLAPSGRPWAEAQGQQLSVLVAAGAFNISLIGLVIGRLVLRLGRRLDTDLLTGLANRSGLDKHLAAAWAASQRHPQPMAVAFIDIDRFKQINDEGGHEAGDRVIEAVAHTLRHQARFTDQVGRWGGDEFMVVMPHTHIDAAQLAMQRLRDRVAAARIAVPAGCLPLTLSIGVAALEPGDETVQDLVMRADAQMYRAKKTAAAHRVQLGLGDRAADLF